MQKILIVTYYWPPAGGPGVQRWLYFAKYMREHGIEPVIYTPENPHYPLRDSSLVEEIPEGIKVYRYKIWEPYQLASWMSPVRTKRISSGIINREKPGVMERFMLWVRGNLFIPDARKYWVSPSVTYLRGILRQEGIGTVITTGPPHSLHLIGLGLKDKCSLKWIADFRDPWTTIGYHNALSLSKTARKKHRALERKVLNKADAIITTSNLTREEFKPLTPKPIYVITNGYTGERGPLKQPDGPFRLSHIGSLLSGRNPKALWRALRSLSEKDKNFRRDLEIELIGPVSDEILQSLRDENLESHLRLIDYMPHDQALQRQRKAQLLLLVEIDKPETRSIIPGKFFEYLAASRPILAIGPPGWEVASMIEQSKSGIAMGYEEEKKMKKTLSEWYQLYQDGALSGTAEGVEEFHRSALTKRLVNEVIWE